MKLFKVTVLLFIAASIAACSNIASKNTASEQAIVSSDANNTPTQVLPPASTVMAFLKWYRSNEERLNQIPIIKGLADSTTFHSVDSKASEKYLKELKNSGYVSDRFLDSLRRHFVQSNDYLKQHPENDGPVPGFDADLIMKSQDYVDIWENLEKVNVLENGVVDNKAFVTLYFAGNYKTRYFLTKSGKGWLIDNLNNAVQEN